MIYVDLNELEDIMAWVHDERTDMVFDYYLGGAIQWWRLNIWAWDDRACYHYYSGGASLITELGLARDYDDWMAHTPIEARDLSDQEKRETALAQFWRPKTQEAITQLDLLTMGMRGSVITPDRWTESVGQT